MTNIYKTSNSGQRSNSEVSCRNGPPPTCGPDRGLPLPEAARPGRPLHLDRNRLPALPADHCHTRPSQGFGSDNPDPLYLSGNINGRLNYRISGHRGTVHYRSITACTGNNGAGQDRLGRAGFLAGELSSSMTTPASRSSSDLSAGANWPQTGLGLPAHNRALVSEVGETFT